MRKIFMAVVGLILLSGCGTTDHSVVRVKKELKYTKILVMPFTQGDGANAILAQENFLSELSLFSDIDIVGKGQMDETTIKNLGVTHPASFGALDFSATPEGDERRKKVLESFNADAIVFGYSYVEQGMASLSTQMIDANTGAVILSFSKDASIPEGMADESTKDIARKAAQKTIDFLKENVIITKFRRR